MSHECKDCKNRELGCHSWCKSYLEYRKSRDEELKKIYRERLIRDALKDNTDHRCKRRMEDNRLNRYRDSRRKGEKR